MAYARREVHALNAAAAGGRDSGDGGGGGVQLQGQPLIQGHGGESRVGEEEQEAFFKDNPLNMAEMAEMGEEEVFAALIALMGSTSEK